MLSGFSPFAWLLGASIIAAVGSISFALGARATAADCAAQLLEERRVELAARDKVAREAAAQAYLLAQETMQPVIVYHERVRELPAKIRTIVQKIPEYVYVTAHDVVDARDRPAGDAVGLLSGGFRLLHDAAVSAANGDSAAALPDDSGRGAGAAPPVAVDTAAETVFGNYERAGVNARRLELCQATVIAIRERYARAQEAADGR